MFVARMDASTVMSEVRFTVVDVMSGKVMLVTRDPGRAVRTAAMLNGGEG